MATTTLSRRIDKAAEQWRTLQAGVDAKAANLLREAGASLTVPPEQWPQDCLERLALVGWTTEHAQAILERAAENDKTIKIIWLDDWNGKGEAPLMIVQPGYLEKLLPGDAPEDAPATPDAPDAPDAPKEDYTGYVYRRTERKPFPHELAVRRQRPRWTVR